MIRGGFRFHKIDSEIASRHCILDEKKDGTAVFEAAHGSGGKARQGDAQLEGAVFELVNQSLSAVKAYGKTAEPGEVLTQLTCTELGEWIGYESPGDALPYGTYQLREIAPPEGYNLRGNQIDQTFEIREKNTIVMLEKPFSCKYKALVTSAVVLSYIGCIQSISYLLDQEIIISIKLCTSVIVIIRNNVITT